MSLSLKEFVTHAYNVIMKQNLSIWGLISHAVIVTIKQHRKKILKYMIVGTFMNYFVTHEDNLTHTPSSLPLKESVMPAANVIIKQNMRDFLSNMKTTNLMESATSVMDVILKEQQRVLLINM